jgi:ATP-dependent Clp protease adapter protein ClpS
MAGPGTLVVPEIVQAPQTERPWKVILYNCNCHDFDEVILGLQKATGCSLEQASWIANEAHHVGRAVCYEGSLDDCRKVVGILRSIRLQVEMDNA